MARGPKSKGERDLAIYLGSRGIAYEYEPLLQTRNPDFVIETPTGRVVMEVIEPTDLLPVGGSAFDPHPPIRKAVKRKASQGAAAAELGLPYVLVIGTSQTTYPYDEITVPGALFGNTMMVFPVGPGAPADPEIRVEFGQGGRLQRGRNTRFSALAVLRGFNPTAHHIEGVFAEAALRHEDHRDAMVEGLGRTQELAESGLFDPEAHAVYLDVFHNYYSAHPLGLGVFDGDRDRQWAVDDAGHYRCVAGCDE